MEMQEGDRVRVLRGDHEGRTGTVGTLPTSPHAKYLTIDPGHAQVSLDGEPAQGSGGGRGGVSIVVLVEDLEPYDGPAGRALSRDRELS